MNELARLVALLARASAMRQARPCARRLACVAASVVAAAVLASFALGCALAALWIYARPSLGAAGAPLLVAGVLLVLALAALLPVWRLRRRRRAPPSAGDLAAELLAEAARLTKAHEGPMLLAALIAGFTAGTRRD